MGRACIMHGSDESMKLLKKPEGKRPLGRHMCRWKDNSRMDFR